MLSDCVSLRLDSSDSGNTHWRCGTESARAVIRCETGTHTTALRVDGRLVKTWREPLAALGELPGLSIDSRGGRWVGYLGYNLGRLFEELPSRSSDDLRLPLFAFGYVADGDAPADLPASMPRATGGTMSTGMQSSFSRRHYEQAVARVIEYIAAGDCYQVNLAQRMSARTRLSAGEIYSRLQTTRPAVYGALLDFGDFQVISNSPELFLQVDPTSREVTNRPIKGTRPNRPGMRRELLESAKDAAELAMIVDLQRNDLGRVCETGSVRVVEPRVIEEHPTVLHGVATIRGRLRDGVGLVDLLRATFPCGSVTGCPKIRSMQIIDELEPVARGVYCGAIGWVDRSGAMQFNVAIRTLTLKRGRGHFSVGGGIVADSSPSEEYEETLVKARAMLEALEIAR